MRATTTAWWNFAVGISLVAAPAFQTPAQTPAAVPPNAPTPVWEVQLDSDEPVRIAANAEAVFVAGAEPALQARALEDGHVLWSEDRSLGTVLLATDQHLFLVGPDAVHALDPTTGRTQWSHPLAGRPVLASAAAGAVAIGIDADLFLFRSDDGAELVSAGLDAPLSIPPLVTEDLVIAATADAQLVAVSRNSGQRAWTAKLFSPAESLAPGGDRLFVSLQNGAFACLRAATGQEEWRWSLYAQSSGRAVAGERLVYTALFDNTIQAIDRRSGARRWTQTILGRPASPVWLVGDRLFVVQADGVVVGVNALTSQRVVRLAPSGEARHLDAAGLVPGPPTSVFTVTTATGEVRRLSLWRPTP